MKRLPGLLPWQMYLAAVLLGLLALREPAAALTGLGLVVWLDRKLRLKPMRAVGLGTAFVLGILAAWAPLPRSEVVVPEWMENRKVVQVAADVDSVRTRPGKRLQIILKDVSVRSDDKGVIQRLPGKLVWTWEQPLTTPGPGQRIEARLRVKPVRGFANPGGWDSEFYWRRQKVLYRSYSRKEVQGLSVTGRPDRLWSLREQVRLGLMEELGHAPGEALLLALLLGDRTRLGEQTIDLFRRASLAHVLALSGLHLGFVASLGLGLAWLAGRVNPGLYLWLPRQKLGLVLAAPPVLVYLWLGQGVPSLQRAALMFFFWGLLIFQGRRRVLLDGVLFALLALLVLDPLMIHDLGLQLSITAVAGIGLLWPLWNEFMDTRLPREGRSLSVVRFSGALLAVTLSANLALLPLTARVFGQVSPHLMLNLVVLPVMGWVVMPLGLAGMTCLMVPGLTPLAQLFLGMSTGSLDSIHAMLVWLDARGVLQTWITWRPSWPEMIGYWLLGLVLVIVWNRPVRSGRGWGWVVSLGLCLLLAPQVRVLFSGAEDELRLTVLDVGQGQAVLIENRMGRVLVDGGGSWSRDFDVGRLVVAPALTRGRSPRLDMVIMTHPDLDHARGLEFVLSSFGVERFVTNGDWPRAKDGEILAAIVEDRGLGPETVRAGDTLDLGGGTVLEVLWPVRGIGDMSSNEASLVLRLVSHGRPLALLPGDAEPSTLQGLLSEDAGLEADVLVLPHHGSRSSLNRDFYVRVNPDLAMASAGYLHPFGFPHREVVEALKEMDIALLSTSQQGAITVSWQGEERSIETVRGGSIEF